MVNLGSETQKQPKWLQNKGRPNKTIIGLIRGIGLKLDQPDYKQGEETPKGQMVSLSHMYPPPSPHLPPPFPHLPLSKSETYQAPFWLPSYSKLLLC